MKESRSCDGHVHKFCAGAKSEWEWVSESSWQISMPIHAGNKPALVMLPYPYRTLPHPLALLYPTQLHPTRTLPWPGFLSSTLLLLKPSWMWWRLWCGDGTIYSLTYTLWRLCFQQWARWNSNLSSVARSRVRRDSPGGRGQSEEFIIQ